MPDFIPSKLQEERTETKEVFSVKLNAEERLILDQCKLVLNQPKDSTAIKDMAKIGAKVILSEKIRYILEAVFKNKRNNRRNNLIDFE
jgi:hypothetical protein